MTPFDRDSSLQRLCLMHFSQEVWRDTTLKYHLAWNVSSFMKMYHIVPIAVHRDIEELPITELLKERLKLTISSMGTNMFFWMRKFIEYYPKSINELVDCIGLIHWNRLGTIDERQTMRSLYFHGHLPITRHTWLQLTELCDEDCIRDLWSKFVDLCIEEHRRVSRKSWWDIICKFIKFEKIIWVDDFYIKLLDRIRHGFGTSPASQYWANLLWKELSEEKRSLLEMMMAPRQYRVRMPSSSNLAIRSVSQGLRNRNVAPIRHFWSRLSDHVKEELIIMSCSFYWGTYSIPRYGNTSIVFYQWMDIDLIIFIAEQISLLKIDHKDTRLFRLSSLMNMLDMMPDRRRFFPIVKELLKDEEFSNDSKLLMSILRFMQLYQTYVKENANYQELFYWIFEDCKDKLESDSILSLLIQCFIMAEFEIAKFIFDKQSSQERRNFLLCHISQFATRIDIHRDLDECYYIFLWNFRNEVLTSTDERSYFFGPFPIIS